MARTSYWQHEADGETQTEHLSVILNTQSFRQAGGLEAHPELKVVGPIEGEGGPTKGRIATHRLADVAIQKQALEAGITHVFGVSYTNRRYGHPDNSEYTSTATGTGYRPRREDE